jgi:hypothetical protein
LAKCITVILMLLLSKKAAVDGRVSEENGVYAFAWSQLVYGAVILVGYWMYFGRLFSYPKPIKVASTYDIAGVDLLLPGAIPLKDKT